MAITPDELLRTADELAQGDRESDWRNAASRAYYAAYHACIPFAFGSASAEPGHREIADRLTRPTAAMPSRSVGYLLDQCRALRERADTGSMPISYEATPIRLCGRPIASSAS